MNIKPEIIVACDRVGGFGKAGKIPWTLPEDFKHFQAVTKGHVCVMGRHTYNEMLDGRLIRDNARGIQDPITEILRGRESYVVTSNAELPTPGAEKITDLGVIMHRMNDAEDKRKLFVLGGRRMFIQALSWCDTVHLTLIKGEPHDCDVFFPIDVLNKKFKIAEGKETDSAYYVVYRRK